MKQGEVINGYRISTKPTTSGGGQCIWAFAEKNGTTYFIKQFLGPKWPMPTSSGSEAGKERRRAECRQFEQRHLNVMSVINPSATGGGNLVTARDFFRHDTTYYKVTDKIDAVSWRDLPDLTHRQVAVILKTMALSLRLLHRVGFVHGDLKPDNILLQKASDLYTAKLIDFDDSYPAGEPPPPGQIVGDQTYAAPEWQAYVREEPDVKPKQMSTPADIFTFGLVIHTYLTKSLPAATGAAPAASPGDAVRAGQALLPSPTLHPQMRGLLDQMWSADHLSRPSIDQVFEALKDDRSVGVTTASAPVEPGPDRPASRLKIRMDPSAPTSPPPKSSSDGDRPSSRVKWRG